MERTTAIILILVVVILLIGSGSASFSISAGTTGTENMEFARALNTHALKTAGNIPRMGTTDLELAALAKLDQVRSQPRAGARSGVSEHMDDSMGERGEDALEVALNGGSGWDVFYHN